MTAPALVEQVRRELESVPLRTQLREHEWQPQPDYQALAEKVAGWIQPLEEACVISASLVCRHALEELPWRKAVTP